jgi:hypothetical protein
MRTLIQIAFVLLAGAIGSPASAVSLGQIDTFSASNEGWFIGGPMVGPTPVPVQPTGGPSGAGDVYLEITSTGGIGPGSRMVANNSSQWTGDYIAAGVTGIEMDLRNFGQTDLNIRLLFEDPAAAPPLNVATTAGAFLPAGGGWRHVRFSIAPGDLTVIEGDATAALSGATFFRVFHNPAPAFPGPLSGGPPAIVATLGVDNIAAVPEPSTVVTMLIGLGIIGGLCKARRSRFASS